MPDYRRYTVAGGTYFFTQVTYKREKWLCSEIARTTLRLAINHVREKYPFSIDAMVLLPDHLHCIWTLPQEDSDYSTRWRLIKTFVTKYCGKQLGLDGQISVSRQKQQESNLWQRRFWEHKIRDGIDLAAHCNYIHYNPVKHGLCADPHQWEFSSFHRFVSQGIYQGSWGGYEIPHIPHDIEFE